MEQSTEKVYFLIWSRNSLQHLWNKCSLPCSQKHKSNPIVPILKHTNQFNFFQIEFNDPFKYYLSTDFYFFQVNSLFTSLQQNHIVVRRDRFVTPSIWELDTVLTGIEITNCINKTYLRNSQPLSSAKTFLFDFNKAKFQYTAHNSKSLIAILNQNNKNYILEINVTETESS